MKTYLELLSSWPNTMRAYLYRFPGPERRACYGPGNHGHWAMQANNTAAGAFAVLATAPELDERQTGMSRDELLDWALGLARFAISTHVAGDATTTDGEAWGHSWISALCLERMMHGLEALAAHLTDKDRARLARVLLSECDWLLDAYHRGQGEVPGAITAGLVEHNHPENNIWNGCLLHRAARWFPDAPRRDEYLAKGTAFLLNGISLETDATASELVAGKPLSDWHVGANFFPSYGLNHHGYQNVGYMVICLSNIAMMHFSCKAHGWTPPPGLYHHAEELWHLVKSCTFPDGRLLRIGGDTRVRYCYCQDYAVPVWLWARDYLRDADAARFESGWREQVAREVEANADGAFLSTRLAKLKAVSPLYYVRLEGDRACTLSMGVYWHRLHGAAWDDQRPSEKPTGVAESANQAEGSHPDAPLALWSDDYHGSCLVRGRRRIASWTWRAAAGAQGLCLPATASSMAEWRWNLAGYVAGMGKINSVICDFGPCQTFAGGFATCGRYTVRTRACLAEGEADADVAVVDLACVALPDDRTVVVLQRARALGRPYLQAVKGLFLQIGNDLFNGGTRVVQWRDGERQLASCPGEAETIAIDGAWLCVDQCLSVVHGYGPELALHRPAERHICIEGKPEGGGTLYAEEICCGCRTDVHAPSPDAMLFDLGAVVLVGLDARQTADYAQATPPVAISLNHPQHRGLTVCDAHGTRHDIVADFARQTVSIEEKVPAGR